MATNEILPFATDDTGTNLLTQAEYSTDAQRDIGHQPGIARAKLANKAMRQVSLLAAGVAEFIADYQANNVTDGLTPQQIADYLLAAITANIPVIPDASTSTKGIIELATAAESQTFSSSLLAISPATLNQSFKGSNQNLSTNGYQRLPGGLILQWSNFELLTPANEPVPNINWTYPIAFTTEAFFASAVSRNMLNEPNPEGSEQVWAGILRSKTSASFIPYRQSGQAIVDEPFLASTWALGF